MNRAAGAPAPRLAAQALAPLSTLRATPNPALPRTLRATPYPAPPLTLPKLA